MHNYDDGYYIVMNLSAEAMNALHRADIVAQSVQATTVEPGHVLRALLSQETNRASTLLQNVRASLETLRTQLKPSVALSSVEQVTQSAPLSETSRYVIDVAVDEARRVNQSSVGTEYLLLGLLQEGHSVAAHLLQQSGVTYERARMQIYRELGYPGI